MTKNDNADFNNSTKSWICDNVQIKGDIKVRDHCHITRKYRGSSHIDCNVKVKLNHKIIFVVHNLKNYVYHLIILLYLNVEGRGRIKFTRGEIIKISQNGGDVVFRSFSYNNKMNLRLFSRKFAI